MNELNGKHIHIIGIGGTGMSPIALVCAQSGAIVSGSDRSRSTNVDKLEAAGIRVSIGHQAGNLGDAELVVYSSAIPQSNPELVEAHRKGIPTLRRVEFLDTLLHNREVIAVAGTHGKTTTASLIAWTLTSLGQQPGYIIGSTPGNLGSNATLGSGSQFVIEADEYDNMFLGLFPTVSVLTRVEHDHPDCFPTEASYLNAFRSFLANTRQDGAVVFNADDPKQCELVWMRDDAQGILSYGVSETADFRISDIRVNEKGCYDFALTHQSENQRTEVSLSIPGMHNVFNASAALTACAVLGMDTGKAADALHQFAGISRRFETIAEWNNITVIDDYGHHPTEIRATLQGARAAFASRRVWALWQPHTYSRTHMLLDQFCQAFADADVLLVTDIYASRETQTDFGFADLKRAMQAAHPNCLFADTNEEAAELLATLLKPGDALIILSAGDANQIGTRAIALMQQAEASIAAGEVQKNVALAKYSNALCGGPAKELIVATSQQQLVSLVQKAQTEGELFKVVGGLTNILFSDAGFDGLLIINRAGGSAVQPCGDKTRVTVESGMKLNDFVNLCASLNLTGMEWATQIPGSVGGAIYGNAGAYGGDISKVITSVSLLTPDNTVIELDNAAMRYGYRTSALKSGAIRGTLLSGTFELEAGNPEQIQFQMAEITEKRKKFNFRGNGSLGSVFRNPEGNYAGKLITECGLRGKQFGHVAITDHHGNIFVTSPGVKSAEFVQVVQLVKQAVKDQFGIDLTCEIEIAE